MSVSGDKILALCKEYGELQAARGTRDRVWQDIREFVRPSTTDFIGTTVSGQVRTNNAYDSTAIESSKRLAAGLHSYLVNPAERWFSLGIYGFGPQDYDEGALAWLELVADIIYEEHNRPEAGFHTCMHETFLDIAAFGTACPYQSYSAKNQSLSFRSFPMSDCYFKEGSDGRPDTIFRKVLWAKRQLRQEFRDLPPKVNDQKSEDHIFEVVHCTYPRTDRRQFDASSYGKPFASVWVCKDTKELLGEGGFDVLPYHPGRWEKLASEVYGEGPASTCLPDILMLNAMERTLIRAGQKMVDPPIMIPDEGYTIPIATAPGSIIWREPGADVIEPLKIEANLPWGEEKAQQKRMKIETCFHADWLRLEKENKEMTAYEVSDRRNEKLGLLAPNLGRLQGEMLGPLIRRSYELLHDRNRFPLSPPSLQRSRLVVVYISPAARAQLSMKASEASRYVQEMITIAAVKPEVLDYIDFDLFAKKLAEYRSVTRQILRSSESVEEVRGARKEQEQLQALAAAAEPATKALKNVADAQAKGLNMGALV